jgi:hypothetical protein
MIHFAAWEISLTGSGNTSIAESLDSPIDSAPSRRRREAGANLTPAPAREGGKLKENSCTEDRTLARELTILPKPYIH